MGSKSKIGFSLPDNHFRQEQHSIQKVIHSMFQKDVFEIYSNSSTISVGCSLYSLIIGKEFTVTSATLPLRVYG